MGGRDISSLPVQLAIRLLLDSVSYSNPLPDWFNTLTINYAAREEAVSRKIQGYLEGAQVSRPYEVMVPKKNGNLNRWVVPSINDQIVIQACVSSLAETIDSKIIDKTKVFSCRYNPDSNRLALLENQVSAWKEFQDETRSRCESDQCVLQIDLEDAFRSIDRARFIGFLRKLSPSVVAVDLIELLLEALSGDEPGLPLMNDSLFFLGSAYFSETDKLVARRTTNFIRFVDDYRIFAGSREKLESLLRDISHDLQEFGFRINSHKLKLGSAEEYLEAVSKVQYLENPVSGMLTESETESGTAEYIDVAFGDVMRPADMVAQIARALETPEEYLNQGFGRLQLATVKRMRVDALIAEGRTGFSIRELFSELLSQNQTTIGRISERLKSYSQDNSELWRTLWLLYVMKDLKYRKDVAPDHWTDLKGTLAGLQATSAPAVVRLWASDLPSQKLTNALIEQLHDCDYVECGTRYYGGHKNA